MKHKRGEAKGKKLYVLYAKIGKKSTRYSRYAQAATLGFAWEMAREFKRQITNIGCGGDIVIARIRK